MPPKGSPIQPTKKLPRKPSVSRAQRAGLVLAPPSVGRLMRGQAPHGMRVSASADVYCAGAVEYLLARALHTAAQISKNEKKKRVTKAHVYAALQQEECLRDSPLGRAIVVGEHSQITERVQLVPKDGKRGKGEPLPEDDEKMQVTA